MIPTDDPVIPDELGELLRSAADADPVTPAPIDAVQRRACQRRRRRHALVAGGAAAVLVLGGLAIAQVAANPKETERVQTATPPADPYEGISVPQPLLAAVAGEGPVVIPPEANGGKLVEQTASGSRTWFTTEGAIVPTSGAVLADGRRFAVAQTNPLLPDPSVSEAFIAELDEQGATLRTHPLSLASTEGGPESIRIVGATGNDLILERAPQLPDSAGVPDGRSLEWQATISAYDVDSGDERHLVDTEGTGWVAAAGDVLAQATGTDCTLTVSALDGSGAREVPGACEPGIEGMGGLARNLALSPDGRRAAVIWTTIQPARAPVNRFDVIDLEAGTSSVTDDPAFTVANAMTWTTPDEVTLAIEPSSEPSSVGLSGTNVRTIPWDLTPGD